MLRKFYKRSPNSRLKQFMVGFHCVGAFDSSTVKYEVSINLAKAMMENGKMYNIYEMVSENKELKAQIKINYAGIYK